MFGCAAMRLTLVSGMVAVLIATAGAAQPVVVGFIDLPDPAAQDFEDPFRAMGADNLVALKTVVRLRERLSGEDVPPETRPRLEAHVASASATLTAGGYDIEALIGQRWEIAKQRRAALLAVNPALDGQEVALSGYLIPAPADTDGTATGYLVSAVGLCSHLPPPPPNQLVRVRLEGTALPERTTLYTPIRFSGRLHADASDETVFVLDGEVRMISQWTLAASEALLLGPAPAMDAGADARDPLFALDARPSNGALSPTGGTTDP